MRTVSSYGVEIRKQNIPVRQTMEVYRQAVGYLTEIYAQVWEELRKIPETKKRFNTAEHMVHMTKKNTARFDFDLRFPKMPSYLRRSAIQHALGSVSSYETRLGQWKEQEPGVLSGRPKLTCRNHAMPVFYRDVMYREGAEGKDEAYLKLYDGHDWKWFRVYLKRTDMEYLRRNWKGKKASAPALEKRHRRYFLRFSYTEEVTLTKTPVKEQIICSVDLGINTDAVCTIMRSDGTVLGRKIYRLIPVKKTGCTAHWDGSGDSRGNMALRRHSGRWAYTKRLNTELGRKIAGAVTRLCGRKPCRCDRVRVSGDERKDIREEETETASVEKTGYPEDAVNIRHTGKGCVISRTCAWNTSRLAYDGSGIVLRDWKEP